MSVLDRLRGRKPDVDADEDAKLRAVQGELKDLKEHSDRTLDFAHDAIEEVRSIERVAKGRKRR